MRGRSWYLVPAGETHRDCDEVLFSDETLHESIREGVLEGDSVGGVLRVTVEGHHFLVSVVLSESLQSITVGEASSDLSYMLVGNRWVID